MRACPFCAEWLQDEAALCRFCGKILNVARLPELHMRCPACGEWVLARAQRCRYCKKSLTLSDGRAFPFNSSAHASSLPDSHRAESEADFPAADAQPIRVLLVDDIAEARDKVRAMLHKAGDILVVGEATTGEEGLACYAELRPEVVCTNICMPGMNGITMTREICCIYPDAQILILSVMSEVHYRRAAVSAGARNFIAKPPSEGELVAVVRKLGQDSRAQQIEKGTRKLSKKQDS